MKPLLSILFVILNFFRLFGQCPTVDFSIPAVACKNAEFSLSTSITNAAAISWDMCDGSIANTPVSSQVLNNSSISGAYDLTPVEENGNHFLFALDFDDGEIWRYSFGADMASVPVTVNLGNLGLIQNPLGIGFWRESGVNYALVVTYGGQLYRLNFGNSVTNTPTITQITGLTGLTDHRHIKIISEAGSILAIIAGGETTGISILNFGSSIVNQPTRTFVSFGVGIISSLDLVIECSNRYILASGYSNKGLYLLDFSSTFLNPTPIVSQPNGFTDGQMLGLSVIKSEGRYYAIVSRQSLGIVRVDFGNTITNSNPVGEILGVFNSVNFAIGHRIVKSQASYYSAAMNINGRLSMLKFPKNCNNENDFFGDNNPAVSFDGPGTYSVTLSVTGTQGELVTATKSITVTNTIAPPFVINENGACLNSPLTFSGQQVTGEALSGLNWEFGDGTQGTGQNAAHQYSSIGNYNVVLTATAVNGCANRIEKVVKIYNAPVASFNLPAGQLCSNNELSFVNTTPDNFDGKLSYQWLIDNQPSGTSRDLLAMFTTAGAHDVTLQSSIPGCSDDVTQNVTGVLEGPVTNFTFSGQCEDQNVTFTNTSSGDSYVWDFDDGQNSTTTNPTHIFSNIGTYDVTLTASNIATGCNNTKTKSVPVYSRPQVNFLLSPPPFSCNGTPSQFNDLTPTPPDSNINGWAWNFGDAGSSQNTSTVKNPTHTYANAGNYDVSLTATTNFLCSSTLQLPVTISQTPTANFSSTPTCEDVAVTFSGTSTATTTAWNWVIGSTAYSVQNPIHTFNNPGNTSATLNATASNGCIGVVTKSIAVPVKLTPDFSVAKNCVNQQTTFTDITNATADPIATHQWSFGTLGTASGSPVNFTFANTGNTTVVLTNTTQTGCVYAISKAVNIIASPQASFTATPNIGAPPLSVQFANTSVNATSYQWAFRDPNNMTSTVVSPSFVYQTLGEYLPELTAFNAQNCSHTVSHTVSVVIPVVNVALGGLELIEFQNGLKPAVTIYNRGNSPLTNLPLLLNISGQIIRERVSATINQSTSYRYVFSFEFPSASDADYFCVEAAVDDVNPNDNEVCLNVEQSFITFPPYPNPGKGSFRIDWIAQEAGIVNLTIINSMGQEQQNLQLESVEGLNPVTITTDGLSAGVYLVKIKYQGSMKVYRVVVSE